MWVSPEIGSIIYYHFDYLQLYYRHYLLVIYTFRFKVQISICYSLATLMRRIFVEWLILLCVDSWTIIVYLMSAIRARKLSIDLALRVQVGREVYCYRLHHGEEANAKWKGSFFFYFKDRSAKILNAFR